MYVCHCINEILEEARSPPSNKKPGYNLPVFIMSTYTGSELKSVRNKSRRRLCSVVRKYNDVDPKWTRTDHQNQLLFVWALSVII